MALSFWQIALVVVLFLLLFGRGKIPQLMGDLAEGIKSFKLGMRDDETPPAVDKPAHASVDPVAQASAAPTVQGRE
jgi:sec-independent protein translocase protein TatA